VESLIASLM
jgi:hypothetical protein